MDTRPRDEKGRFKRQYYKQRSKKWVYEDEWETIKKNRQLHAKEKRKKRT